MRGTDTKTISLPPAMARQMEKIQKEEHRTFSELVREAWRHYFDGRYPAVTPTKSEAAAIRRGRADIKAGRFATLDQLRDEPGTPHSKPRSKSSRKVSR